MEDKGTPAGGLFGDKDFYQILDIERCATASEIKKAYRRMALKFHPDKHDSPDATEKFQMLAKVHAVLSDPKRREFYDKHGEPDDEISEEYKNSYEYWRSVFPVFTEHDIDNFRKKYIGSSMEKEDLIDAYAKHQGDMRNILECVPFADASNLDRLKKLLREFVREGEATKKYLNTLTETSKNLKQALEEEELAEAEEAEVERRRLGLSAEFGSGPVAADGIPTDLAAVISQRQKARAQGNFLDNLAAKYAQPKRKERKKKDPVSSKISSPRKKVRSK